MAIRTTAAAVGGIIEVDASIPLDPFIELASAIVDDVVASLGHSASRLEQIERLLSAHFYTLRDPRSEDEKAGPVSQSFQSKVDLGFSTSHYGQQAMLLDTKGGLASLNRATQKGLTRKLGVAYLGTTTQSQERAFDATP